MNPVYVKYMNEELARITQSNYDAENLHTKPPGSMFLPLWQSPFFAVGMVTVLAGAACCIVSARLSKVACRAGSDNAQTNLKSNGGVQQEEQSKGSLPLIGPPPL